MDRTCTLIGRYEGPDSQQTIKVILERGVGFGSIAIMVPLHGPCVQTVDGKPVQRIEPTTGTTGESAGGKDAPAGGPDSTWDRADLRQFCKDRGIRIAPNHSNDRILQLIREWQGRQKVTERVEPLAPGEDEP